MSYCHPTRLLWRDILAVDPLATRGDQEPERLKPYGVTAAEAFRLIHAVDAHGKLQVSSQ